MCVRAISCSLLRKTLCRVLEPFRQMRMKIFNGLTRWFRQPPCSLQTSSTAQNNYSSMKARSLRWRSQGPAVHSKTWKASSNKLSRTEYGFLMERTPKETINLGTDFLTATSGRQAWGPQMPPPPPKKARGPKWESDFGALGPWLWLWYVRELRAGCILRM